MASIFAQPNPSSDTTSVRSIWLRRLLIALLVLACIGIGAVALYAISLISAAVILLLVSALLAYMIYPLIQFFQRRLPRPLAIIMAYLVIVSVVAVILYIVMVFIIQQSSSLVRSIQFLLSPEGERQTQPFIASLGKFGISQEQIAQFKSQVLAQLRGVIAGFLPFLVGTLNNIIVLVVVVTLSVYFVLDGVRIIRWLCLKTPAAHRDTITFLMHALDQSLGGYLRGMLLLGTIGALSTGSVLALLHVPYAALLGVLFFLLFFIPVIGGYVIGPLCILAALPQGGVTALIVAIFMVFLQQILLGQILSPRVFSRSVGLHPIVALFALFAGGQLFGVLGGFLSVPVAGVIQQIIVAQWHRWKANHPEQFPPEETLLSS